MMGDPYDTGTPKYQTASGIYEGLCTLTGGEEIGILSNIFPDVSYDGQDYYYIDKGSVLKEKFEGMSGYSDKMWLIDLAVTQIDLEEGQAEIHDTIFEALVNLELAKRLGFKNLFTDIMLRGNKSRYSEMAEAFEDELRELNRFDYWGMIKAYHEADKATGGFTTKPPTAEYSRLCHAVCDKVRGLHLQKETQLIVECRALLTSYDDFILALRMNQELYERLERRYAQKMVQLQAGYDEKLKLLYLIAERNGIALESIEGVHLLESGTEGGAQGEVSVS